MPRLPDYVRANPDRAARDEDLKIAMLKSVSLREAQQFLHQWRLAGEITEEQQAVMFMMLNQRAAREEME